MNRNRFAILPWIGILLCLPALGLGIHVLDDAILQDFVRQKLAGGFAERPWFDAFNFVSGDPDMIRRQIRNGELPWWTAPDIRVRLFRPLSVALHYLDFGLFKDAFWIMHLQSLIWYGLVCALLVAVLRRFSADPRIAFVAALLFVVDDAHVEPVAWLAHRNALIAFVFGMLSLLAYDRSRRTGSRSALLGSLACFILSLAAGETGVSMLAYFLAYALFMDRGRLPMRLGRLIFHLGAALLFVLGYRAAGFGTVASGAYLDPMSEPLLFGAAFPERFSRLLEHHFGPSWTLGDWLPPPLLEGLDRYGAWVVFPALAVFVVRRAGAERELMFWAIAGLGALVPQCVTLPHERLLIFAGPALWAVTTHGAFALLKMTRERRGAWALLAATMSVAAVSYTLVAPVGLSVGVARFGHTRASLIPSLPLLGPAPELEQQHLLVLNARTLVEGYSIPFERRRLGLSRPARCTLLGATTHEVHVTRLDERSFRLFSPFGYLQDPMAAFFRGPARPFAPGSRLRIPGMEIRVERVTLDGRPLQVQVRMNQPISAKHHRFIAWYPEGFRDFRFGPLLNTTVIPADYDPFAARKRKKR
jgi:hypothetical protein